MELQKSLQKIILIELLVPLGLLVLGSYHGVLQTLFRAGVIRGSSFAGIEYYQGLTAHGVINALVLTTFFAVALGHVLISQELQAPLSISGSGLSMVLMLLGTVMAAAAILAGKATVLYTFYPPLKAHPAFYLGLAIFIVGSWIALYTWIPPYLRWRKVILERKPRSRSWEYSQHSSSGNSPRYPWPSKSWCCWCLGRWDGRLASMWCSAAPCSGFLDIPWFISGCFPPTLCITPCSRAWQAGSCTATSPAA